MPLPHLAPRTYKKRKKYTQTSPNIARGLRRILNSKVELISFYGFVSKSVYILCHFDIWWIEIAFDQFGFRFFCSWWPWGRARFGRRSWFGLLPFWLLWDARKLCCGHVTEYIRSWSQPPRFSKICFIRRQTQLGQY